MRYEEARRKAKAWLPRMAFDFVEGGSGQERTLSNNRRAFETATVVPSLAAPAEDVDLSVGLFGHTYSAPIGLAPIGLSGLVHPRADILLARCAARHNIPFVLSCTASTPMEEVARSCEIAPWIQAYVPQDMTVLEDTLHRALAIGSRVLILTTDMSMPGDRQRDAHNDLRVDGLSWKMLLSAASRPGWAARRLAAGPIGFPNLRMPPSLTAPVSLQDRMKQQTGGRINWEFIKRLRDIWPHSLALKGVLCPDVAARAFSYGVEGVIVSNHGGRQLDCAPASLDALASIISRAPSDRTIMLDSGVRDGEDVLKSVDRGARSIFVGRLALFALAAEGQRGVDDAIGSLVRETRRAFALAGRTNTEES